MLGFNFSRNFIVADRPIVELFMRRSKQWESWVMLSLTIISEKYAWQCLDWQISERFRRIQRTKIFSETNFDHLVLLPLSYKQILLIICSRLECISIHQGYSEVDRYQRDKPSVYILRICMVFFGFIQWERNWTDILFHCPPVIPFE